MPNGGSIYTRPTVKPPVLEGDRAVLQARPPLGLLPSLSPAPVRRLIPAPRAIIMNHRLGSARVAVPAAGCIFLASKPSEARGVGSLALITRRSRIRAADLLCSSRG